MYYSPKSRAMSKFKMVNELLRTLSNDNTCREFLEGIRWKGTPKCPHCGHESTEHYRLNRNGEFHGKYKCKHCCKTFTVTVGTIFEGSHISLYNWFYAIIHLFAQKKGISSIQLSKDIGVTQKTAWTMLQKIRCNLTEDLSDIIDSLDGIVQVDETYVGGKTKGKVWQNQGRSLKQKVPVVGLLTESKVIALVTKNVSANTLQGIVRGIVKPGSTIVTDGLKSYKGLSELYRHEVVEHNKGSYKNKQGFYTNGIEGFWSQLKRGIKSTYHVVSRKYLQFYCNEFSYRYSNRHLSSVDLIIEFLKSDLFHVDSRFLVRNTS